MASFPCNTISFLLAMTAILTATPFSLSSTTELGISIISAAPSTLPTVPASAPAYLAPDIMPLLPSPGATAPSPSASGSEGEPETIPASPSPPNPDEMAPAGPNSALSPSGSFGAMASTTSVSGPTTLAGCSSAAFVGVVLFCFFFLQLIGSN